MAFLIDAQFWTNLLRIIWIDLLLAGDNAVVIALAVRSLPPTQQWWGRIWGTVGAVALRLLFLTVITFLLNIAFLKLAGGLVLIWIAVKLVRPQEEGHGDVRGGTSLWEAIWIIMVADLTMSLDNVLAVAGAAGGDFRLLVLGIAISIPLVVFGSGVIGWLMNRWVWIVWVGGGILGYVAGEMILSDTVVQRFLGPAGDALHYPVPIGLGLVLTALGWWFARRDRARRRATQHA
ncbi:MAG TPA: TerC family protein [Methylomirabilota bacterium]|nr:TerC family protein [Methylomirabilota bacterium]